MGRFHSEKPVSMSTIASPCSNSSLRTKISKTRRLKQLSPFNKNSPRTKFSRQHFTRDRKPRLNTAFGHGGWKGRRLGRFTSTVYKNNNHFRVIGNGKRTKRNGHCVKLMGSQRRYEIAYGPQDHSQKKEEKKALGYVGGFAVLPIG
ncbi:hypothetical protein KCU85_g488, partial [Aureobasidium melanogenum]